MTSEKKPLHKIVAEHLRDNPGQYWTPQELGRFLAESHYDFFSQKAAGLKGRTSLANQLAKEVYAQKGQIASKHSDIQIDASKKTDPASVELNTFECAPH